MRRRPNILILMVDQMSGTLCPAGPADFLHTPRLKAFAERALRFRSCYTPSTLCLPSPVSFMSGLLPSGTGVYDNPGEGPAAPPTLASRRAASRGRRGEAEWTASGAG